MADWKPTIQSRETWRARNAKEFDVHGIPRGSAEALKTLKGGHRIPEDVGGKAREAAERAFDRMIEVMEEKVDCRAAPHVLKAATAIREEVCGPIVRKIQVTTSLEQMLAEAASDPGFGPPGAPALNVTVERKALPPEGMAGPVLDSELD